MSNKKYCTCISDIYQKLLPEGLPDIAGPSPEPCQVPGQRISDGLEDEGGGAEDEERLDGRALQGRCRTRDVIGSDSGIGPGLGQRRRGSVLHRSEWNEDKSFRFNSFKMGTNGKWEFLVNAWFYRLKQFSNVNVLFLTAVGLRKVSPNSPSIASMAKTITTK